VAGIVDPLLVILAVHNTIPAQLASEGVLLVVGLLAPPILDDAKHAPAAIHGAVVTHVALGGVVEDAVDDAVDGAVYVHPLIIYTLDDLRDDPLEDLRGNLPGGLVENLRRVSMGI
jgi:hypothetical protein